LATYPWSSLPNYLNGKGGIVEFDIILSQFKNALGYRNFIFEHSDYAQDLEFIKHQLIDVEFN
jgi:predicted membrane-bound spermidine synthase